MSPYESADDFEVNNRTADSAALGPNGRASIAPISVDCEHDRAQTEEHSQPLDLRAEIQRSKLRGHGLLPGHENPHQVEDRNDCHNEMDAVQRFLEDQVLPIYQKFIQHRKNGERR